MTKETQTQAIAEPFKFKNAALLNRLSEMAQVPYYATACHTLIQAEMAIVELERENATLRAEVERLAAQAAPSEEMSPEFTDTARAALLWVLWHHQGGSSKVGQPIRFALGMGQHQPLSNYQVREAQRWEAMAPTRDAANVPPGEWNSEPEGLTPKQAWWAGYRVGKGLPPDMPRSEAVAAQPSQAPVVQAVQAREYPPLPEPKLARVRCDQCEGSGFLRVSPDPERSDEVCSACRGRGWLVIRNAGPR